MAAQRVTNDDLMSSMLTLLGGVVSSCYTGYSGNWLTWEVVAGQDSEAGLAHEPQQAAAAVAAAAPTAPADGARPPLAAVQFKLVDDAVNIRLWKDEGSGRIEQANLYQAPDKMAGSACTRFTPYLRADATRPSSIRPDGYGLRSWTFDRDSDLVSANSKSWLDGSSPIPPHRSMRVLSVPNEAVAIINGALPPAFEPGKGDIWVLEFIQRDPASSERRWATMNWYEDGRLVVNRSINEDRVQLPADLSSYTIKPDAFRARMAPRRDSTAVIGEGGIDGYVSAAFGDWGGKLQATKHIFTWDENMQLTYERHTGCRWRDSQGGPGRVVEQVYPDCSYCRQPLDLGQLLQEGRSRVTFESGTVMRDGGVGRWLLTYDLQGKRMIKSAVFERYAVGDEEHWGV